MKWGVPNGVCVGVGWGWGYVLRVGRHECTFDPVFYCVFCLVLQRSLQLSNTLTTQFLFIAISSVDKTSATTIVPSPLAQRKAGANLEITNPPCDDNRDPLCTS